MSRTKRILVICLVVAAISAIIMVVNAVLHPETGSVPVSAASGVVPVVLCIALLSSKEKADDQK